MLYLVAKPSALVQEKWIGQEGVDYISEGELIEGIRLDINASDSGMSHVEGQVAIKV